MTSRRVLWVSTATDTRGGIATFVRTLRDTPLWAGWAVRHVATHRNGSVAVRCAAFGTGLVCFLRELVLRRPGLVHLHTSSYGSFARKSALSWICRAAGIPVVLHVHGGGFGEFHTRSPRLLQRYIRSTLGGADRVVALGDRWADVLRGIAPDARVVVVPNAVRPQPLVDQPPAGDPVHVLFVGEVTEDKGAFVLLEAWARLDATLPPADLVVVGPGDLDRARRRVRDLGLAGRVELTGWVDPGQVEPLLRRSHVLVLPSRFEGQPMAVLEAMAHGLCVVASDVGGIPDLLDDTCGVLVPADDAHSLAHALRDVIGDPARRARLGAAAWARLRERFDVDVTWRQLDALYRELVG